MPGCLSDCGEALGYKEEERSHPQIVNSKIILHAYQTAYI
jgi:hypothetical protein